MNDLTTFSNPEFGQVRTVEINGTPWLVGKDVAVALGYKNPQRAIRDHVDTEDQGVTKTVTPSGEQEMLIINESGLYSLILSSKMPKAKAFKHWVTSEVLPAIHKTGAYESFQAKQHIEQLEATNTRLNAAIQAVSEAKAALASGTAAMCARRLGYASANSFAASVCHWLKDGRQHVKYICQRELIPRSEVDSLPRKTKRPARVRSTDEPKGDGFSTPHYPEE